MDKEMVSVIIPTYNREQVVGRAIESVLRQTYPYFELLVVDDGSTDCTQETVERIGDDRLRYIRLERNSGPGHARNIGIQEAKYDYLAFQDSDDEWMPRKLELQMQKMLHSSKRFGAVYCRMNTLLRSTGERMLYPRLPSEGGGLVEGMIFDDMLRRNPIAMPTFLVRRECIEKVGGLKETLRCYEDWEWFLRIAKEYEIGFVEETLLLVHKMEVSVTTQSVTGGWPVIVLCYLVCKYRQEMIRADVLEEVEADILERAKAFHLYEEAKELLKRDDIEL